MPSRLARAFLRRGWLIRAGAETTYPASVTRFYLEQLRDRGVEIAGKRVLLFGYGGRFDVAVMILEAGAVHVVLCDLLADSDHRHNVQLLPRFSRYLEEANGRVVPRASWITTIHGDIREFVDLLPVDIVFSNSVFEHLRDVQEITDVLAGITHPAGIHLHRIDLRDHYFRYPFEMLRFSDKVWARFLNPTTHHNRYRLWDFQYLFESSFDRVDIEVLHGDPAAFERIRDHIRQEFLSGDPVKDAATIVLLVARKKKVRAIGDA